MQSVLKFIRNTIASGLLLLLPLTVCIWALGKLIGILRKTVEPVAHYFPFAIAGLGKETIVAIIIMLIMAFLLGIFMKSSAGQWLKRMLEENVLIHIPGYAYLQALSTDKLTSDKGSTWRPATILVDDNEVLCFVTGESEHYYSIFLPSAPTPNSGSVCAREKSAVRLLPCSVTDVILVLKRFGAGCAELIEKAPPAEQGKGTATVTTPAAAPPP